MAINSIENRESGGSVRGKMNALITEMNRVRSSVDSANNASTVAVNAANTAEQNANQSALDREQTEIDAGIASASATSATTAAEQARDDRDAVAIDAEQASSDAANASQDATTASNMADAVAEATETYTSVSAGLAATVDTNYFRVIEAPDASRVSVYRNDAGAATLITTYYTKAGVDAKQAAAVRLNRSLQRLGDNGQTLHADFAYGAYGVGDQDDMGVSQPITGENLFTVERATPKWVQGPNGKLREVPPDTVAREWKDGVPQGVLIEDAATNKHYPSSPQSTGYLPTIGGSGADNAVVSIVADSANPVANGDTNVWKLDNSAATSETDFIFESAVTGNTNNHSISAFIKVETGSVFLDLRTSPSLEPYSGSTWNRVERLDITPANDSRMIQVRLEPGAIAYVTGLGLEEASTVSSYIPTTDAAVTRAADNVSRTLGDEVNINGDWALYLDYGYLANRGGSGFVVGEIEIRLSNAGTDLIATGSPMISSFTVLEGIPDSVKLAGVKRGSTFYVYADGDLRGSAEVTSLSSDVFETRNAPSIRWKEAYLLPYAPTEAELVELTQ